MNWIYLVADLVLITALALGLYRRRHGRKDLVIAFIGANAGVYVVAGALSSMSSTTSLGVGLGLFGVLSIIRLRSTEIEQHDVAYFFSSLAIGLVAGLAVGDWHLTIPIMALPVAVLALVDRPGFMHKSRRQRIVLDRAITDEFALRAHLERLLGAEITQVTTSLTDLVQDKTVVDVTYRVASAIPARRGVTSPADNVSTTPELNKAGVR